MRWLSFIFPQRIARAHSQYNESIEVREVFGRNVLLVDGIEQTGPYVESLFRRALQILESKSTGPVRDILVFGVGGGAVFPLIHSMYPKARVTGVDVDGEIIRIGKKYFGLDECDYVWFVISDARRYIDTVVREGQPAQARKQFDLIVIDLYVGNDVPRFATEKRFFVGIRRLLRPGGVMMMNYYSEKDFSASVNSVHTTLSALYRRVESKKILRNVFFYCSC